MDDDETREKQEALKTIGPFYFDIDDYIDTVVLDNQQIQEDLHELNDILDQGHET